MESVGCEDLDVIVGAGYAAARAALSAQEGRRPGAGDNSALPAAPSA